MPQGYGCKVGATDELGHQPDDPQPQRLRGPRRSTSPGRSTGSRRPTPARTDIKPANDPLARRRRRAADLPGLRRREGLRHRTATASTSSPTRSRPTRRAPGYEERSNISNAAPVDGPQPAARRSSSAPATCIPGGEHVDLQVARDGPDAGSDRRRRPGRDQAAVPLRRQVLRAGRRGQLGRRDGGDAARLADQPEAGRHGLDQRHLQRQARRRGTSRWGSCRWPGAGPTDPAAKDPFDDAAAVKAMYDEGGVLTHAGCPRTSTRRPARTSTCRTRASCRAGARCRRRASTSAASATCSGGFSAIRGFPHGADAPAGRSTRAQTVTFTNHDALPGEPNTRAGLAQHHLLPAPCNKGSGIGYPLANGPIKFDSGQLGYGTGPSSGVTTGSNVYTTPPLHRRAGRQEATTYTYFCRIHPFMRGSIRVRK